MAPSPIVMAAEVLALLPGPPPRWMFAAALARGATDSLPPRTGGSRSRSSARTPSRWEDAPSHPPAPWRKRYRADATGTQRVGAGLSGSRHRGAVRVPTPCGHPRRPAQISPARLFSPRPRRRSARRTSHRLELTHAGRLTAIPLWTVVTSNDQPNARCTRGSPEPEISQEDEHHDHDTDDVKDVVHPGLSFPSGVARGSIARHSVRVSGWLQPTASRCYGIGRSALRGDLLLLLVWPFIVDWPVSVLRL
jgi:hypothetical protein